jgi:hypothetical protein
MGNLNRRRDMGAALAAVRDDAGGPSAVNLCRAAGD